MKSERIWSTRGRLGLGLSGELGGVISQREGTPLGESNQKQGLAVGITVYLQFVLSTQSLSASRLPICEMKETETNLPPRVSTQCNALKKKRFAWNKWKNLSIFWARVNIS